MRNILCMLLDTLINAINGILETYTMYGKDDIAKLKRELMDITEAFNAVNHDRFAVELNVYRRNNTVLAIFVTVRNPMVSLVFKRYRERVIENFEDLLNKISEELRNLLSNSNKTLEGTKEVIKGYIRFYNENFAPIELLELKKEGGKVICLLKTSKGFIVTIEQEKV